MLRPRPEPSDLAASLVPRMGDVPFASPGGRFPGWARRPLPAETLSVGGVNPAREAADAAEQQAIADAVEGVLP